MEAVEIAAVVAATWGVFMALSPILQIRRIVEQGSSDDVSLGYFWVLTVGFSLWLVYGILDRQWPLIIPNSVALAVSFLTVAVTLRFRRSRTDSQSRRSRTDSGVGAGGASAADAYPDRT